MKKTVAKIYNKNKDSELNYQKKIESKFKSKNLVVN